jgi:hypothetical protein
MVQAVVKTQLYYLHHFIVSNTTGMSQLKISNNSIACNRTDISDDIMNVN